VKSAQKEQESSQGGGRRASAPTSILRRPLGISISVRADWFEHFRYDGARWTRIPADGTKAGFAGLRCYNGIKLRQQGAPEAFIRKIPICTPAEIGR